MMRQILLLIVTLLFSSITFDSVAAIELADQCSSARLDAHQRRERSEVWKAGSTPVDEVLILARKRIAARVAKRGCIRYIIAKDYVRDLKMYGATYGREVVVVYRFFPNDEVVTPEISSKFTVYAVASATN